MNTFQNYSQSSKGIIIRLSLAFFVLLFFQLDNLIAQNYNVKYDPKTNLPGWIEKIDNEEDFELSQNDLNYINDNLEGIREEKTKTERNLKKAKALDNSGKITKYKNDLEKLIEITNKYYKVLYYFNEE